MTSSPGRVDATLHDGLGIDRVLTVVAIVGLCGWLATQFVASNPGLVLELVGTDGTTVLLAGWLLATVAIAGVIAGVGSRAVTYSPPLWIWGGLVAVAMATNVAVVAGFVPDSMARYALWGPWIAVYTIGYLVTAIAALGRSRIAYLTGSLFAAILALAWLAFPPESQSWVFALTGLVHAGPIAADVVLSPPPGETTAGASTTRSSTESASTTRPSTETQLSETRRKQ